MMMRKSVFDALGGYDESLSYEDFDFWVRAARKFKFAYTRKKTRFAGLDVGLTKTS